MEVNVCIGLYEEDIFNNFYLWVANWKMKDSGPNRSRHSLGSICSSVPS
jgi:hypothetical protein